jgi:hypothetical protein
MRYLLLLPLLVLGLAACAKPATPAVATAHGGSTTPKATPSAAPTDRTEAMHKFAQCMRDHGVDVEDPQPGEPMTIKGGPGDKDKMDKAQKACQQYMPGGGEMETPDPQMLEQVHKYAQCMRDHGIDMPDPDPNEPGKISINGGPNPESQAFKDAEAACQHLMPQPRGKASGGTTR